ncbi:SLC13 family permease [Fructilactobacillus vespulae]|uniref:SLC13 family permease n=1 Tax=Fructilactobacillus vespulae TaxID=1249630 RepID=UPI0039B6C3DB
MKIIQKIIKDRILLISLLLAVASLLFCRPTRIDIDWNTIISLLMLMISIQIVQYSGLLIFISQTLTKYTSNTRNLVTLFVLISFFSSMFLTNDVAIISLIPLLAITLKNTKVFKGYPVILICLAANLGSMFTPIGNPQNLFLFNFFHLKIKDFFTLGFPICLVSLLVLLGLCRMYPKVKVDSLATNTTKISVKNLVVALITFLFVILSIINLIPMEVALVLAIINTIIVDKKIFMDVDYSILITFICFFIAVSGVKQLGIIAAILNNVGNNKFYIYYSSILFSQVFSNVPTAILIAPFTNHYAAIYLGTNIGGLGTPVASLANLLAYKQFKLNFPEEKQKRYVVIYTVCNVLLLIPLVSLGLYLLAK